MDAVALQHRVVVEPGLDTFIEPRICGCRRLRGLRMSDALRGRSGDEDADDEQCPQCCFHLSPPAVELHTSTRRGLCSNPRTRLREHLFMVSIPGGLEDVVGIVGALELQKR